MMSAFFIFMISFCVMLAGLLGLHYWLIARHTELGNERLFPRQLVLLGLTLLALVVLIMLLPVTEALRTNILSLLGILISGVLAFSSGHIFANLAAGILLRVTKPFGVGDFIEVKGYFGRVAERGLFDTEIQSDRGELIALPNTFLIANPISTVRNRNAVVNASLSLGYDLNHSTVEPLLIKAAAQSGLDDAFVRVVELGDVSITYRVSGTLAEAKGLVTAQSTLYKAILDELHSQDIEIMSPSIMAQRALPEGLKMVPQSLVVSGVNSSEVAEQVLFDKAEQAVAIEEKKEALQTRLADVKEQIKQSGSDDKDRLKTVQQQTIQQLDEVKAVENSLQNSQNARGNPVNFS